MCLWLIQENFSYLCLAMDPKWFFHLLDNHVMLILFYFICSLFYDGLKLSKIAYIGQLIDTKFDSYK